jgi:hypothetical protein
MKKKSNKEKLIQYVEKKKGFYSDRNFMDIIRDDPKLKLMEVATIPCGETLYWIFGFGESGVFYLRHKENSNPRKSFYYLTYYVNEERENV